MKCPECGKELTKNRILDYIYDESGSPILQYCVPKDLHNWFIKYCENEGLDPNEQIWNFLRRFMELHEDER